MLSTQQPSTSASPSRNNTAQMADGTPPISPSTAFSPIQFIYKHLHDAIRAELDFLGQQVHALDGNANMTLEHSLTLLKTRYKFLTNIYKYHSSVEDEVIYPALDSKVRNVTLSYRVEHEDEERLFEELVTLITNALVATGESRTAGVREFVCKVEEVHTTLRKHLLKEEEQLLPLLLHHFTVDEQAQLIAQSLCCIPLAMVGVVLSWVKTVMTVEEQQILLQQVQHAMAHDQALLQLLVAWLACDMPDDDDDHHHHQPATSTSPKRKASTAAQQPAKRAHTTMQQNNPPLPTTTIPPLRDILYLHQAIRSALEAFVHDAQQLTRAGAVSSTQLSALVDKHRFLRAICTCHSTSEEEVVFPAARQLSRTTSDTTSDTTTEARLFGLCDECEEEHAEEASLFEDLGRLLGDVKASTRRGAREAAALTQRLCRSALTVRDAIGDHLLKEESQVFPLLESRLEHQEQRALVWHAMRAMPLRLIERVVPAMAGTLTTEQVNALVNNFRLAAPLEEAALVELLSRWTNRAATGVTSSHHHEGGPLAATDNPSTTAPAPMDTNSAHPATSSTTDGPSPPAAMLVPSPPPASPPTATTAAQPIDHIFQFHKALRRDMRSVEAAALQLDSRVQGASEWTFDAAVQDLEGRFTFLWGIYQAHSKAEDEIVFPALEKKEATHNISHAYTLDHQQEGEYFTQVEQVFRKLRQETELEAKRTCVSQLRRMCASIRASVETHVRAEENELWPVFVEHFTVEEQQGLVGQIIGRTGAEVLQVMLPWVTGSFTAEEEEAMMKSLRSATKNTMFSHWLDALEAKGSGGDGGSGGGGHGSSGLQQGIHKGAPHGEEGPVRAAAPPHHAIQSNGSLPHPPTLDPLVLSDLSRYIRAQQTAPEGSGAVSDSVTYVPGWNDIFRMNEQQLQGAIRRVCNDPTLEPQRKSYIVQHIMTSRYIASQQRRMMDMYGISSGNGGGVTGGNESGGTGGTVATDSVQPSAAIAEQQPAAAATTSSHHQHHPPTSHVTYHNPAARLKGCKHYQRGARIISPCCGREVTCRLCHDELITDHRLDRYDVKEMVCMHCNTRQPIAQDCSGCGHRLAAYYCDICHLFDDEPGRAIYHCPFCNVCRRGKGLGIDFFHCMTCNSCMSLELFGKHKCREKSLECTCPVCSDYLFDSNLTVKELPCGHFMHSSCFAAYTRHSYTCPVCSRSLGDMRVYWRMLDSLLASEQDALPPEYANRMQTILCNDCGVSGEARFHFVYHRCGSCHSYNTRVTAG